MKIFITAPGNFTGAQLKVSCYYNVELQDDGTDAQNKTFHALLQCFWRSIMTGDFDDIHSSTCYAYDARNFEHFRALVKLYLGAGMEKFINLANPDGTPCNKGRIDYRLKSWGDYTKKERQLAIDSIITEMMLVGVKDKHFDEILVGMDTKQTEKTEENKDDSKRCNR